MVDVLIVLAVWRLTSLFVREEGPFDIFPRLRLRLGVKYEAIPYGTNVFSKAIICVWCFSLWVALPFAFLKLIYFSNISNIDAGAAYWFITWMAYSAATIIIDEVLMRFWQK